MVLTSRGTAGAPVYAALLHMLKNVVKIFYVTLYILYEAERHKPGHPRCPGLSIPSNYLFYFSIPRDSISQKCERNGLVRVNRFTRVLW